MKIMVAFLGKKKNKRNEYLEKIKSIHKNKLSRYDSSKSKKINYNYLTRKKDVTDSSNKFKFSSIKSEYNLGFNNVFFTLFICLGIAFLIFKVPSLKILLTRCSINFRQADSIEVDTSDIISSISLFNKDNYIVKESSKLKEENNSEKDNNQESSEESEEYKIIDEEVKKYDLESVFSNNDIKVNILSENATVQKLSVNDTLILNYSSNRNIDFESIISKDVILTKKSDKILLYSTHTSESYTNSENYKFEYSSVMRSLDAKYNMISIAKELNQNLLKKGFSSIHNTTPHDYGAYTGAYLKSRETVVNALTNMGSAGIIIDVHRDAMEDLTFRPVANINGIQVSQLMFVVGIGDNKYWEDNLRLALKLQEIANNIYPGLFRQIVIRDSTYNQDLNKYSMLVEFGATGNTIDEVKLSTRCLANLLNIIYKD